jgi:basic membrane protein A and related proteins
MSQLNLSRRSLLKAGAAGIAAAALPLGLARAQSPLTIGAVYVGPRDDFGWNQAHAVAMEILKSVPGVTVIEEENVPRPMPSASRWNR